MIVLEYYLELHTDRAKCALVSRTWTPYTQALLFANVSTPDACAFSQLLYYIIKSPHIARYIRHLSVALPRVHDCTLHRVLVLLTRLSSYTVTDTPDQPDTTGDTRRFSCFWRDFTKFRTLRSLSVAGLPVRDYRELGEMLSCIPPHVVNLTLAVEMTSDDTSPDRTQPTTATSVGTLASLRSTARLRSLNLEVTGITHWAKDLCVNSAQSRGNSLFSTYGAERSAEINVLKMAGN